MTGEAVLIAALSGRALAQSARRAGYLPLVVDVFGDLDTRQAARAWARAGSLAHGFSGRGLLAALEQVSGGARPIGVVAGTGFEDRPALLDRIAERHALLGNDAATVARAKDPMGFAALCRAHGVPHPAVSPEGEPGWLVKRAGGSGGYHIRDARRVRALRPGRYAQRRVGGRAVSALFLGNGRDARVLGFSEQWCAPLPRRPFRYGGALHPARVAAGQQAAMRGAVLRLSQALGLRGLNSADFMLREDGFDVLEINPRPGATLDIHPDERGQLFRWHIAACAGELPDEEPAEPAGAAGAAVVYAPHVLRVPRGFAWPGWSFDRPEPGSLVACRAPLCTVRAEAADAGAARALLADRERAILAMMDRA